jgi:O-methyltransferase
LWDVWGYAPVLQIASLPITKRVSLVAKLVRIDWRVPHAHKPRELAPVFQSIAERPAVAGEAVVEAGCWMGGSSAKLSLLCRLFGYRLHIYDSFQGVEPRTSIEGTGTDYSGSYAAQLEVVRDHIARYGDIAVCDFHAGWFADTLAVPPQFAVRVAYIDCDLVKGTAEVLAGIVPALVHDGLVYSQDYHIVSIRQLLHATELWRRLGRAVPEIEHVYRNIARIRVAFAGGAGRG